MTATLFPILELYDSRFINSWVDIHIMDYYSFAVLNIAQQLLYQIFYMSYMTLCLCFSIDLYQTIKNPLYPAKKRMTFYFLSSLMSNLVLFLV